MRYRVTAVLFMLLAYAAPAYSQSLSLFDLDTSAFPLMKGKFFAFDASGAQASPSASELGLTENGVVRNIVSVTCPPVSLPKSLSSVLVIDVSGSMAAGPGFEPNIELAKAAARAWVNGLPLGANECAITSFDHLNYLNHDFTTNHAKLLSAIDYLTPGGGTDYDQGLLLPLAGGLQITPAGKYQKVIIFLTDGQPQNPPDVPAIIAEAQKQNCIIYAVTLGMTCPQSLRDISEQTGGNWYENVTTVTEAESIYRQILYQVRSSSPCEITWRSAACANGDHKVVLRWSGQSDVDNYTIPSRAVTRLRFSPSTVNFRSKPAGLSHDTTITVTALNGAFTVTGITSANPAYDIDPKSFTLAAGESRTLTVRYTPSDSGYTWTEFELQTAECPQTYTATGGFPGRRPRTPTLKVDHPNGGEVLVVGSDTVITWSGIPAIDQVRLDYSTDNGATWLPVQASATGRRFAWHVPNTPSDRCLVRARRLKFGAMDGTGIIHTLEGHGAEVKDLAWSPDGSRIATASLDYSAMIWDAAKGTEIVTLNGHIGNLYDIAWSPDGKRVATASEDDNAMIWDAATGNRIHLLTGHIDDVVRVAWSPDSTRIVTASTDGTAKIWDASSGALLMTLSGHNDLLLDVSWSPDSRRLATSGTDGEVKIWDASTSALLRNLVGHTQQVSFIAWSRDGARLATAGYDNAKIWNSTSGALIHTLNHPSGVMHVSWNPDGTRLATGGRDNIARVWDPAAGRLLRTLPGHTGSVAHTDWNPDGSRLATAGSDRTAKLWDPATGALIRTFIGHANALTVVKWSPDGNRLATSSDDATAKIWSVDETPDLEDVSDAVFSIVIPVPASEDVDMGQALVGTVKDSIVTTFVRNNGSYPFRVDSIRFAGGNAAEFAIVSGAPPFEVPAGGAQPVEFRFTPTSAGVRSAQIEVHTQLRTLVQNIRGEGIDPVIEVVGGIIDFGQVEVGAQRDTIRAVTVRNTGALPLTITATRHAGPNDKDFTTLAGGGSFLLQPGDTARLDLRYSPSDSGRTSGRLLFEYNGAGSPATVQLFGEGLAKAPLLAIINDTIDFGQVQIGTSRDTIRAVTITNKGTAPLVITGTRHAGPDAPAFATLVGGGPFMLPPGDTALLDLRFTPSGTGPANGELLFEHAGSGSPAIVQLLGEGIDAPALAALQPGSAAAEPGDVVDIPIRLTSSTRLAASGATRFTVRLRFDATLLEPIEATPKGIIQGEDRIIDLDLPTEADAQGVLATLRFRAGLGDDSVTSLVLEEPQSIGGAVIMSVDAGEFRLLGICEAGGARLVNPNGVIALKPVRPNPVAGSAATVELETTEIGRTQLFVSDIRGSVVKTFIDGEIAPGRRILPLDLEDIPTGVYFMTLMTPTERRTIRLEVAR